MRPWTICVVGAVAFLLTLPATANAGPRLGPGAGTKLDGNGAVFWPRAADDLLDYAFFPKGKDKGEPLVTVEVTCIVGARPASARTGRPRRGWASRR